MSTSLFVMDQLVDTKLIKAALLGEASEPTVPRVFSPLVFRDLISNWPASKWTPQYLSEQLGSKNIRFRIGKKSHGGTQWETLCQYCDATLSDFMAWELDSASTENPLSHFDRQSHWCYADYKYMAEIFAESPHLLEAVQWASFGFEGRNGVDSTFWLGSQGAHTVCHYDMYGCNLVAQLYGRKQWVLFPPSDSPYLYPSRIPYEESSVFSEVNIKGPDLRQHPRYKLATRYEVTLNPGEVLFVPRHWWHQVENLETSISINTWLELECDKEARLHEAVTRLLASALISHSLSAQTDIKSDSTDQTSESKNSHEQFAEINIPSDTSDPCVTTDKDKTGNICQVDVDESPRSKSSSHLLKNLQFADSTPSAGDGQAVISDVSTSCLKWLNPTEELTPFPQNVAFVQQTLELIRNSHESDTHLMESNQVTDLLEPIVKRPRIDATTATTSNDVAGNHSGDNVEETLNTSCCGQNDDDNDDKAVSMSVDGTHDPTEVPPSQTFGASSVGDRNTSPQAMLQGSSLHHAQRVHNSAAMLRGVPVLLTQRPMVATPGGIVRSVPVVPSRVVYPTTLVRPGSLPRHLPSRVVPNPMVGARLMQASQTNLMQQAAQSNLLRQTNLAQTNIVRQTAQANVVQQTVQTVRQTVQTNLGQQTVQTNIVRQTAHTNLVQPRVLHPAQRLGVPHVQGVPLQRMAQLPAQQAINRQVLQNIRAQQMHRLAQTNAGVPLLVSPHHRVSEGLLQRIRQRVPASSSPSTSQESKTQPVTSESHSSSEESGKESQQSEIENELKSAASEEVMDSQTISSQETNTEPTKSDDAFGEQRVQSEVVDELISSQESAEKLENSEQPTEIQPISSQDSASLVHSSTSQNDGSHGTDLVNGYSDKDGHALSSENVVSDVSNGKNVCDSPSADTTDVFPHGSDSATDIVLPSNTERGDLEESDKLDDSTCIDIVAASSVDVSGYRRNSPIQLAAYAQDCAAHPTPVIFGPDFDVKHVTVVKPVLSQAPKMKLDSSDEKPPKTLDQTAIIREVLKPDVINFICNKLRAHVTLS